MAKWVKTQNQGFCFSVMSKCFLGFSKPISFTSICTKVFRALGSFFQVFCAILQGLGIPFLGDTPKRMVEQKTVDHGFARLNQRNIPDASNCSGRIDCWAGARRASRSCEQKQRTLQRTWLFFVKKKTTNQSLKGLLHLQKQIMF